MALALECENPDCERPAKASRKICGLCANNKWRSVAIARAEKCAFPECRGIAMTLGLCDAHTRQRLEGIELKPTIYRRSAAETAARNEHGQKQCASCLRWQAESDFQNNKQSVDGLRSWCRGCARERRRLNCYGVGPERWADLWAAQEGRCPVCTRTISESQRLAIDHDHNCCPTTRSCGECVRGILCTPCNVMLGMADDSVSVLAGAINYLENWSLNERMESRVS